MASIKFILIFVFCCTGLIQAQVNRYMVFFTDKNETPYSVSAPEEFLSDRALARRERQSISVTEQDLPVDPAYVQDIRDVQGVTVLYKTKWMNGVLVECDDATATALDALPIVDRVEYVAPGARPSAGGRIRSSGKFKGVSGVAEATDVQLELMGADHMHAAGYRGEGMLIAIMDAGFPGAAAAAPFQHIFNESRFDASASYDFVTGSSNVFVQSNHGTHVFSIMGAFTPDSFTGGAHKSNYMLFITEYAPSEYRVEEYNWLFAAERADSAGVNVINTSLGYTTFDDPDMNYAPSDMDGATAVITRAANMASSKGIAVVVSAGNEGDSGWAIVAAPADSEHVLSVGSVNSSGIRVPSSSKGPTSDGRVKPDVAALGSSVSIISPSGSISSGGGTSYASPLVASLVAGTWQMLPELTVQQLFDTIRASGSQSSSPDFLLGYGIPNFISIITATEEELHRKVHIFPNPATREIFIEFSERTTRDQFQLVLTDARGISHTAPLSTVDDLTFSLDISSQQPGLYILQVLQGNTVSTHKIIKIE
jgi:serine protease AprX